MARDARKGKARLPRLWWALPLAISALSCLIVAALILGWGTLPPTLPTFHLFFSDYTHMKLWLATIAIILAFGQLLWAARMYGLLRFPPSGRFYALLHRWSGRLALLLTLPIAYHCLILVGQRPPDLRVLIHATLGAFFYGVVATKLLLVRAHGANGWVLPVAGGTLFAVLFGLWVTSVPWFITLYGISI